MAYHSVFWVKQSDRLTWATDSLNQHPMGVLHRDDRMGAKIKTQKNPLGFKQNHPKNPWTKFHPKKVPCRISEP